MLAVASWAAETVVDFCEYSSTLKVVENYKDILNELRYCSNKNVSMAAKQAYKDMDSLW